MPGTSSCLARTTRTSSRFSSSSWCWCSAPRACSASGWGIGHENAAPPLAGYGVNRSYSISIAVRARVRRDRVGANRQFRHPVHPARARTEHRRRLRRAAGSGLHRLLCGGGVHLRAPRQPAFQSSSALLGDPADRRWARRVLRPAARRADAQAARRLPRHRHPRLRRDRAHFPQQPVAAGQHHQRPARRHRHRSVPHRRPRFLAVPDAPRPPVQRTDQVLLPAARRGHRRDHHQPPAAELAHRPRLGSDPRGRDRRRGDGHQHAQREAARLRHGRELRGPGRRHVFRHAGVYLAGELRAGRIDHGGLDGRAGRHGQHLGRDSRGAAAVVRARDSALDRPAGAGRVVRAPAARPRGDPHADLRARAGAGHALSPGRIAALGGQEARAHGAGRMTLLQAERITKRFGGLQALSEVSFSIRAGEIFGLIGPNGAGKTTLFNVLTGLYAPDAGAFLFDGHSLAGLKPHQVAAAGIARTFQNIRLFANLSALENVMIGRRLRRCSATPRSSKPIWGRRVLLEVRGLEVHYGGIRAVKGIDLAVDEGELVCLIGANGAGKTSTLKAICRLIPSRAGTLRYRGEDIATSPVHALPRKGLVMVPEGRGIFRQLTVEENLAMGAYALGGGDPEPQYASFPRLRERRKQIAGTLSGGEQQMLAMARALMTRPKLLLLDEPSMGLAPLMVAKIFEIVREIARQGVTILLVEQNARLALELARRGYVMESGAITLTGTAGDLLNDSKVREAYLGEGVA